MLPYSRQLKQNSRELRSHMTDAEQKLWYRLRRKQINGWQFYRQKPMGSYIVDFYCPVARLVVELDGSQHFEPEHQAADRRRDAYLAGLGLRVLRFDNRQVLLEMDAVLGVIAGISTNPPQIPPSSQGEKSMSNLPKGWAECMIGDATRIVAGGTPPSKETSNFTTENSGIPWITPADLSGYKQTYISSGARSLTEKGFKNSSAKKIPAGSVLFSSRAPIGYVAIASNEISTNQGFKSFVLPEGINNHFIYYYLKYIKPVAEEMATGTTFKELSGTAAAKIPLIVAPSNEQKRIADKLDAVLARVDACRDRLERIPAILKRFRQSVLAAATSGKLTEDWRISDLKATGQYVSSEIYRELPDLPSSWCYERLGKLLQGLKYGTSQKCEYEKKGMPVLRIPNIGDGVLLNGNMKYAELPEKEYQQLALQAGDILLIRSNGSVSLVGKTALVSSEFVGYAYAGYLIRLRPNEEVRSDYLSHVLASMWLRQQIEIPARSTSGINNINSDEVRNLLIPLPSVDEQTEIVRRVESLFAYADRLETRYTIARAKVEKLTPATLAKAFRGELVPQDPHDEPASALLARIHAQRDNKPKARK